MRLSPKRRSQWTDIRHLSLEDAPHILFARQGKMEVVRMGRGEPIVLVPGLAGGWKLVAPLARRLAKEYEVILCGLRGDEGLVPVPQVRRVSDYAGDVADVIEHLRLERPTVLGVSFGGAVALQLATERPGLIGALAVHGAEARFHTGLGSRIAVDVLERFPLPVDNRFVNQFFNLLHGGKPESAELADFVVERCWETDQGVMAGRLRALEAFDVEDRLWRIDVPTVVIAGTKDVIVPPARQQALAEKIPGARFVAVEGAGHIGFLTHGAEVARPVGRLVRGLHRQHCA